MRGVYTGKLLQSILTWSSIFVLALPLNIRLFYSVILSGSLEPQDSFQLALTQVPAEAQLTELRMPREAQAVPVDDSISCGLPVAQEVPEADSVSWRTLRETLVSAPSGSNYPNLHDRAPPFR